MEQLIGGVTGDHPLGTMNVCTTFRGNTSNNYSILTDQLSQAASKANKYRVMSWDDVRSDILDMVTMWMITEWHLFNVIRRKTLFIHQTSQLWSISNFNILRMHIWQWQQKVYGLYEINSNIAHLQLGWRKINKTKGLIFILKRHTDELWYSWNH